MEIKLENKTYEIKANGYFLKRYQDIFKTSCVADVLRCIKTRDYLVVAQLIYASLDIKESFEEWLNSFENPFFIAPVFDSVLDFFINGLDPTVKPKQKKSIQRQKILKEKTN